MKIAKITLGIILCLFGVLLVLFEFGMAKSEPHAFRWLPFLVVVLLGVVIFAGGMLLCKGYEGGVSTNIGKIAMGIVLCAVGVGFACFACAEAISEWHSFLRDGWIPFSLLVVFGILIFAGGILLCKG